LLIANGRRADEPVALVRNATLKDQQVLETTLGTASADVAAANFKAPAIIVIGEVVRLRAGLDWLGALEGRILQRDPLDTRGEKDVG
ncbi:MAG TPA: uroporphyrin-III methyltransferase, partial [Parvibaculum sp.]